MPDVPGDQRAEAAGHSLVELRVLEGPNLYFPRAAVKATLDLSALTSLPADDARRIGSRIGIPVGNPGEPGSGLRQRFAARVVARLVRRLAAGAGTSRLALRVRATTDVDTLVVAYPWRHRTRAEALAIVAGDVLDRLPTADLDALLAGAAERLRATDPGPAPTTMTPTIPVVAITGTNGKTTTARLVAHIGRTAGLHVGWSSTDGVYADGVLVEPGDYSGPGGAARVLAQPGVELAVVETARGGILLRGMGVTRVDVSVVTNISADHLGLQGIDTLDELAEVKSVVPRITKKTGWAVLNGDDPRVLGMQSLAAAPTWVFSRDDRSPAIRDALTAGGRATTVIDGQISVLMPGAEPQALVPVVDVPVTMAGLSRFNVENALAAASAGLALGFVADIVAAALASFAPGPADNPGRMNVYTLHGITVVVDLAHNEAGLRALVEVANGLRGPSGHTHLGLGTAGDRTAEQLRGMAELAVRGCDDVVIVHKLRYLRGRTAEEMAALYVEGADRVGVTGLATYDTELEALRDLVERAEPGDVVALMCQQDRDEVADWLGRQGATVDDPETLRGKVLAAAAGS